MSTPSTPPFPEQLGKPVCVFCASSAGNAAMYTLAATSLGEALAKADIPVVYGGGRRGIMGVVSHSALEAGGYVHGVLPKALVTRASEVTQRPGSAATNLPANAAVSAEGQGTDLLAENFGGRLSMEVVGSMHERKAKMAKLSTGGFIVLPGGFGTFEELMEMITWNQIGMHALPVIVLNVGNYYTPMKALIENGVKAGFISAANAKLVEIVDIGDEAANDDESRAAEWGPLAVKTIQEWTFPAGAGYGFKWEDEKKTAPIASGSARTASTSEVPYLFSTGRFTSPSTTPSRVTKSHIVLWDEHLARLRRAHAHFARADLTTWGSWVGDDALWEAVRSAVQAKEEETRGDWRIRMLIHPGPRIEVQVLPAPPRCREISPRSLLIPAPFAFLPPAQRTPARKLFLDPAESPSPASELDYRQYKTARREAYESAAARMQSAGPHPEVVLHANGRLLEGVTSNIAIQLNGEWITPTVEADTPILPGTMRAHLLKTKVIREGILTIDHWRQAKEEKWRVIAFNGLRGVFECELA